MSQKSQNIEITKENRTFPNQNFSLENREKKLALKVKSMVIFWKRT